VTATYEFLSPEWIVAVRAVRDEFEAQSGVVAPTIAVKANVIVTDAPFADPNVHGSLDTSSGQLRIEPGHVDQPDFAATLDYDTAKALLVGDDPNAVMQAFFTGKIRLTGDSSKLLVMQASVQTPTAGSPQADMAIEIARRIRALTA
jgi:hypothetical protein